MSKQEPHDVDMVGRVIDHEVTRYGKARFIADSGVSRSSLNKAVNFTLPSGFDSDIYPRIEHALGLPDRTFQFIAIRALDELERIGVRPGLIEWIRDGGVDPIPTKPRRVGRKQA